MALTKKELKIFKQETSWNTLSPQRKSYKSVQKKQFPEALKPESFSIPSSSERILNKHYIALISGLFSQSFLSYRPQAKQTHWHLQLGKPIAHLRFGLRNNIYFPTRVPLLEGKERNPFSYSPQRFSNYPTMSSFYPEEKDVRTINSIIVKRAIYWASDWHSNIVNGTSQSKSTQHTYYAAALRRSYHFRKMHPILRLTPDIAHCLTVLCKHFAKVNHTCLLRHFQCGQK